MRAEPALEAREDGRARIAERKIHGGGEQPDLEDAARRHGDLRGREGELLDRDQRDDRGGFDQTDELAGKWRQDAPDRGLPMGGVPKRSAFIIDREGIVQYAESSDNPKQLPNFDAIKAKLNELA